MRKSAPTRKLAEALEREHKAREFRGELSREIKPVTLSKLILYNDRISVCRTHKPSVSSNVPTFLFSYRNHLHQPRLPVNIKGSGAIVMRCPVVAPNPHIVIK